MRPLFIISDTDDFTASDLSDIIIGTVPGAEVAIVPRIAEHVFDRADIDRLTCVLLATKAAAHAPAPTFAELRRRGVGLIWIGHALPADGPRPGVDLLLETPFTNETVQRRLSGLFG